MLNNIPAELRRLKQWVCAGPDKVPLTPRTGKAADPTNPNTWGTYEEAIRSGYKHVGFVLSHDDPYSIIDLDEPLDDVQESRHTAILGAMSHTYAEYSQSRRGVHIICRGNIPAGVRRDKVEVYSAERYMICTGDVLQARPIEDCQEVLTTLYNEMQSTATVELNEDGEEKLPDEYIVEMATNADNGDKFGRLWRGEWQGYYPSQSEADFALMAIIGFYTRHNGQARRLFRASALGQRDKAQRDKYLNYMLGKVRAHQPPEVNLEELLNNANKQLQIKRTPPPPPPRGQTTTGAIVAEEPPTGDGRRQTDVQWGKLNYPPGIIGDIARYFEASAIRPVPEIALGAAIGLVAGVAGRSYNISGTGLNQYLVLLAKTGSGKEGAQTGIDTLIAAVRETVPMADTFMGPATFASGQALVRILDQHPCFVSVLGEIGITLQHLCDPRAPTPTQMLKKVLLDLYTKSGWNKVLRPSVYSDSDKNTKMIQAPAVTILGESTPDIFYGGLDHSHILEGLIPRFSIMEYTGPRPDRNPNAFAPPPEELVNAMADLTVVSLTCRQNNSCCPVSTDWEADELLNQFDDYATKQINTAPGEVEKHLWNRAHLKALKMAALLAVGVDPKQPVVTRELAEWACQFVTTDVNNLLAKFTAGDIGSGESKQENDLKRAINDYFTLTKAQLDTYAVPTELRKDPVIPFHYLRRRTRMLASFKNDRLGPSKALNNLLEEMVKSEMLVQVPGNLAWEKYQIRSAIYTTGATWQG